MNEVNEKTPVVVVLTWSHWASLLALGYATIFDLPGDNPAKAEAHAALDGILNQMDSLSPGLKSGFIPLKEAMKQYLK